MIEGRDKFRKSLLTVALIAKIPHDLIPWAISPEADWYSFVGNAASILGFVVSVIGLLITFAVKRQVKRIEGEYVVRLESNAWRKAINSHAMKLQDFSGATPFPISDAEIELTKIAVALQMMEKQMPPDLMAEAALIRKSAERWVRRSWWLFGRRLNSDETFNLHLKLINLHEKLRHSAVRFRNQPTR